MGRKHDNRVQGYLNPRNHKLSVAYCAKNEIGESEFVNTAINKFFGAMDSKAIMQLLNETKPKNDLATWPV